MKLKLTITDLCLEIDDTTASASLNLAPIERAIAELARTVANFPAIQIPAPSSATVAPTIMSVTDLPTITPGDVYIAPATNGHSAPAIDGVKVESSKRIKFEDFDKLVRLEMKRLNMDGRMPSMALWDSERKPPLPTMGAVMARYGVTRIAELAGKLDMPPR